MSYYIFLNLKSITYMKNYTFSVYKLRELIHQLSEPMFRGAYYGKHYSKGFASSCVYPLKIKYQETLL